MSSTRFHKAARDGLIEVLKEATASDVNEKDVNGMTPVLWASFEGKLEALRLLVGRGGDPDKQDQFGNSALHCACAKGHMHCVDFLVKFGTNFYALDIDGHNAKDLAVINNWEEILRYLDQAITTFEMTEKKKSKAYKEAAEKKYEKLLKKYAKRSQKLDEANESYQSGTQSRGTNSKLTSITQKLWKGTIKGQSGNNHGNGQTAMLQQQQVLYQSSQPNNYSSFVNGGGKAGQNGGVGLGMGNTLKGIKGTMSMVKRQSAAVKMNKQRQQQLSNPFNNDDFKIGEIEPESGKRSVRSIHGLRRDSEVLYVGTFQHNPDAGKRGAIGNLFEDLDQETNTVNEEDEEDGGGGDLEVQFANGMKFSTISRSLSQPNFMRSENGSHYDDDDLNEEVMMQRPSGIFSRPSLGHLSLGRSVTATLAQMAPETVAVDVSGGKSKKLSNDSRGGSSNSNNNNKKDSLVQAARKFQPRDQLSDDEDSDTDVVSSDEDQEPRNSYSSLERFLVAYDLEEYYPIFQKQKIDLDTLMILTESDIKSLELPLGPFRRLVNAIQQRSNALKTPGPIVDSRV